RDAVRGLVQAQSKTAVGARDAGPDRRRAVAQLHLGTLELDVQSPAHRHLVGCERGARTDDDRVRPGLAAQRVERFGGRDPEALALAGREPPEADVAAELLPLLVDDRAVLRGQPVTSEEVAVVAPGEEARLLALGTARGLEARARGLGARLVLALLAEREPEAVEEARIEPGQHVRLILSLVVGAGEEQLPVALDDPRVVAGRQPLGAGALGEREQLGEAEAAVAADARVRRLAGRVAAHERLDHCAAELLAQVERDVRKPSPVTGRAGRQHGLRRAAGALRVRA